MFFFICVSLSLFIKEMFTSLAFSNNIDQRCKDFLNELTEKITLNDFTEKAREKIRNLLIDPRFIKIKADDIERYINISRASIYRLKSSKCTVNKKPGPKEIINEDVWEKLSEISLNYREKLVAITIRLVEQQFATVLSTYVTKKPSRWTISRAFKKHRWRRKKSQRRHPYYITKQHEQDCKKFVNLMKEILPNFNGVLHVMDESGVYSNMFPMYTFSSPDEKDPYVKTSSDTTKDTVIVTISSNGKGDLLYVPFRRPTKNDSGCSGVEISEMEQWTQRFINIIGKPGDILIMDNLQAHHNIKFIKAIENAGIRVIFFPVRGASKFSPCDNCFFAVFKMLLGMYFSEELSDLQGNDLRIRKRDLIYMVFHDLIRRWVGIHYFKHCGYDKFGLRLPAEGPTLVPDITVGSLPFPFENEGFESYPPLPAFDPQLPAAIIGKAQSHFKICMAECFVNSIWKQQINQSEHPIIKIIAGFIIKATTQRSLSVDKLQAKICEKNTLDKLIDYIQTTLNTQIKVKDEIDPSNHLSYITIQDSTQKTVSETMFNTIVYQQEQIIIRIEKTDSPNQDLRIPESFTLAQNFHFNVKSIIVKCEAPDQYTFYTAMFSDRSVWAKFDKT